MHGPLPSTSELALLLPSWPTGTVDARWNPTDSEWGKKNVPWFWSEDDFAQQTRALVRANTPAREHASARNDRMAGARRALGQRTTQPRRRGTG